MPTLSGGGCLLKYTYIDSNNIMLLSCLFDQTTELTSMIQLQCSLLQLNYTYNRSFKNTQS